MAVWLSLLLLALVPSLTSGIRILDRIQVVRTGQCPNVPVISTLDVGRFAGTWYELQRYAAPFEFRGKCGQAEYTQISADTIGVVNSGKINLLFRDVPTRVEGQAVVVDPAEPGRLRVSFGGVPDFITGNLPPNYLLVDTDYDNYAVVFSCARVGFINFQYLWILTRVPGQAPANLADLLTNLSNNGVDTAPLLTIDQNAQDCGRQ